MTGAPVIERRRALRREIERIAAQVARRRNVDLADLLGSKRACGAESARHMAMQLIVSKTGCSATELAWAWGCSFSMVRRALSPRPAAARRTPDPAARRVRRPQPLYGPETIERLRWQHGPERVANILNGTDDATNADIAAWRRLGSARA